MFESSWERPPETRSYLRYSIIIISIVIALILIGLPSPQEREAAQEREQAADLERIARAREAAQERARAAGEESPPREAPLSQIQILDSLVSPTIPERMRLFDSYRIDGIIAYLQLNQGNWNILSRAQQQQFCDQLATTGLLRVF